jgi:hypothetical protein
MLGVDEVGAVRSLDGVQRVGRAGSLTPAEVGEEEEAKTRVPCSTEQCQEAKEKVYVKLCVGMARGAVMVHCTA